jgi:hypothetical protein
MTAKRLSILALAVASFMPPASFAQTSLNVANVPGYPGAMVSVPVSLRNTECRMMHAECVVAAQFDVAFNVGKVNAGGAVGTTRLANHTVKSREIAPGVRRTLVYSLNNTNFAGTDGAIVNLPFTVSLQETVSSGPLTPGNVILARPDGTAVVPVSLSAGTIFVRPVNLLPNGHVQFFLYSTEGERYIIQATTNLVDWVNISTNTATSSFMDLVDIDAASYPFRFYRWELLAP